MSHRKSFVVTLCTLILLAGCRRTAAPFECTDAIGCVEIAPDDPIKIGALQAMSGGLAPQGTDQFQSAELAVEDRGGKLLGHPIELLSGDSSCSAEGGTTEALKMAADPQMVGIVGPTCSGAAATAMKVASEAGLVMISGSSSAPSLTSVGGERAPHWQPGFFRAAPNDAREGQAAATFAYEVLGVKKAAIIDDGDLYTRGLTATFEQAFAELGGEIVLAAAVNKGDTDMRPVLTAVAGSGAELLFFPLFRPEVDYVVLQVGEVQGMEEITLMAAEGLYVDDAIDELGEVAVGVYFITPATPRGAAYDAFFTRYETKYNEPPTSGPYHPHTYDATNLLLNAIEAAAVDDASEEGKLYIGRQALRDAMYATSGYEGLTGSLACDEYGDCGAIRLQVTRLDDPAAGMEGLAANVIYTYPPGE